MANGRAAITSGDDEGALPANGAAAAQIESDFSPRKLKSAMVILVGQTFATSIVPLTAFTLVMIPLTREFGWSRTEFSFAESFLWVFGSASTWPMGRLADKVGCRPVILVGTVAVGIVTFALALQTRSLLYLYTCYALLGLFGSTILAYTKLAAALFTRNRGKALAALGAESTAAAAIVPLLINELMLRFGWREMYMVLGSLIIALVPLLYFGLAEPGRELSRTSQSTARAPRADIAYTLEGMTVREALKDRVFWLIAAALLIGFPIAAGMLAHLVPALMSRGFTQTQAADMLSVFTLAGLGGSLLGGFLADRFHTAKIAIPFSLLNTLSVLGLLAVSAATGGLVLLVGAMALGGFCVYGSRPMGAYFHTRYFGLKAFTEIYAVEFTMVTALTALSPPLVGAIYDHTRSYRLAFELWAVMSFAAAVIWTILPRYRYAAGTGALP